MRFASQRPSVSTETAAQLMRLRSIQEAASISKGGLVVHMKAVLPQPTAKVVLLPPVQQYSLSSSSVPTKAMVVTDATIFRETTRLLHESEAVVVVEYIEAIVPMLYAAYISILVHLLNAKYYADMKAMAQAKLHQIMTNIRVYALFELLSLAHIAWQLKRSFRVSVFYQLAFALERDWRIYQCILLIFSFLLAHVGTHAIWFCSFRVADLGGAPSTP